MGGCTPITLETLMVMEMLHATHTARGMEYCVCNAAATTTSALDSPPTVVVQRFPSLPPLLFIFDVGCRGA